MFIIERVNQFKLERVENSHNDKDMHASYVRACHTQKMKPSYLNHGIIDGITNERENQF